MIAPAVTDRPKRGRRGHGLRPVGTWGQVGGKRVAMRLMAGRVFYDAAATTGNDRHWNAATLQDADTAIAGSLETLRKRCRYEAHNNPNVKGIIESFVADVVGTGPRLQVTTDSAAFNRSVERRFSDWTGDGETLAEPACDLTGKDTYSGLLRLAVRQLCDVGEVFFILQSDRAARPDTISLRLLNVEADRVATPWGQAEGQTGAHGGTVVQGIEQDAYGRPLAYYVLKDHPGNSLYSSTWLDYDIVPAERVIHLARADRAGQTRGVPWLTPSLPIFSKLRDYENAELTAALTAASLNVLLEGDAVDPDDGNDEIEDLDEFELPRDAAMTLPAGWRANQLKSDHPTTTFKDFRAEMINAGGRPLGMPSNVARGNSENYNYASGRLDHLSYEQQVRVVRKWLDRIMGRRVARAWMAEAILIPGYLEDRAGGLARGIDGIKATWFWPGYKHMDPSKEAIGQEKRLKNGTTTLSREWGEIGEDWETQLEQAAREHEKLRELGLADDPDRPNFENYARAVRSGVPVGVTEARVALALPEEVPPGPLLRFNDQDVLQYHIEAGVITINEVRTVLGLPPMPWGDVPVRKNTVRPVARNQEADTDPPDGDRETAAVMEGDAA